MERIDALLKGTVDIHVHSGPGMIPRKLDHYEATRQSLDAGIRALVLKDHHAMTSGAAYFINEYLVKGQAVRAYGSVCLNNAAGGLNPYVVDAAIKYDAKVIWFPTVSAENHIESHKDKEKKKGFPDTKEKPLPEKALKILDSDGKLLPQVSEICKLIAKADVVLGTGHLSVPEIKLLIDEAKLQGVKRILVDHPEFTVNATIPEMVEFADKGAFIEHTCVISINDITTDYLIEMIKAVGAERTIISSDLGQTTQVYPVEGLKKVMKNLLDAGIKEDEVDLMFRKNPSVLLGID
jgi:predicted peroxiredoxin